MTSCQRRDVARGAETWEIMPDPDRKMGRGRDDEHKEAEGCNHPLTQLTVYLGDDAQSRLQNGA